MNVAYAQSKQKKQFHFYGYFSVVLNLTIVVAAVLWVVYGRLPNQYYLPISFGVIALTGLVAFLILNKKVNL
jgi:hypothetical protein